MKLIVWAIFIHSKLLYYFATDRIKGKIGKIGEIGKKVKIGENEVKHQTKNLLNDHTHSRNITKLTSPKITFLWL